MSFSLTLKRNPEVVCFDIAGTIALSEKVEYLQPILECVCDRIEHGEEKPDDPDALAGHLLGDRTTGSLVIVERLLSICHSHRLLDRDEKNGLRLTESGMRALEDGMVLRPQEKTWRLWACDDPLLPFPIIAIDSAPAYEDSRDKNSETYPSQSLPSWITKNSEIIQHKEVLLLDNQLVRFDDISAPARSRNESSVTICWTPQSREIRVTGDIGKKIDTTIPHYGLPEFDEVWMDLLRSKRLDRAWDTKHGALCIPFQAAKTENERINMQRTIFFKRPMIEGYLPFDDTKVSEIPLRPMSDEDASLWARYQLEKGIREVQTERTFQESTNRIRERFKDWKIDLPDRRTLAEDLARDIADGNGHRSRTYWALWAALDWSL